MELADFVDKEISFNCESAAWVGKLKSVSDTWLQFTKLRTFDGEKFTLFADEFDTVWIRRANINFIIDHKATAAE